MSRPLGLRPFDLVAEQLGPADLEVVGFQGEEAISDVFSYRVEVTSALPYAALEEALFGRRARLVMTSVAGLRAVTGVVRSLAAHGARDTPAGRRTAIVIEIAPRLALLRHQRSSRIFQDMTAAEIVTAVLDDWEIPHRFALAQPHGSWEYCVQHQESDYDFLRRLLAAEGIWFAFAFPPAEAPLDGAPEVVVLGDSPGGLPATEGDPTPPVLRVAAGDALLDAASEQLGRWSRSRAMASAAVQLRDYAPANAAHDLLVRRGLPGGIPAEGRVYDFLPPKPLSGVALRDEATARRALEQARAPAVRYEGAGNCRSLRAGLRLRVDDTGEHGLDGEHVVVRLRCQGRSSWADARDTYEVAFEALGAEDPLRPPPEPARTAPPLDTAVVTGPPGTETYTDALGRVRVRFRWDLDQPASATSSCWLRVAQGWTGAGFGSHFLPRVGMEVLVGYLGGDINRPIVLGCVPNSATPGPFPLPGDAAKSGVVSRSTPGGDAGSSIVFDDTADSERLAVHAQRDLETVVRREQRTTVGGRRAIEVGAAEEIAVKGGRVAEVAEDDRLTIGGARRVDVAGAQAIRVGGAASATYAGGAGVNVRGQARLHVDGEAHAEVEGPVSIGVEGDAVVRGGGHTAILVGSHAAARSLLVHVEGTSTSEATRTLEIASDEAIRLRCGDSSILITSSCVQITTPKLRLDADTIESDGDTLNLKAGKLARIEGKKAFLISSGASVCLTGDVKIDGGTVYLKEAPDSSDGPEARSSPPAPTTLKLTDQDGSPIPGERYQIVLGDGTERSGVLDANGEATIPGLQGSAQIRFPDLPSWKEG